jgi:hypothetical protein
MPIRLFRSGPHSPPRCHGGELRRPSPRMTRPTLPSLDRLQGDLRGEGPSLYLERLANLQDGADAHATKQQDLGAEPLAIFEHTGGRRFEFDSPGKLEVASPVAAHAVHWCRRLKLSTKTGLKGVQRLTLQ